MVPNYENKNFFFNSRIMKGSLENLVEVTLEFLLKNFVNSHDSPPFALNVSAKFQICQHNIITISSNIYQRSSKT